MPVSQINARIDADLKADGDRALASIGSSPTEAIRALWGFASRNRQDKAALRRIMNTLEGAENAEKRAQDAQERTAVAKRGPRIIEAAFRELGITDTTENLSYDDLIEQAYLDKWEQRGLL